MSPRRARLAVLGVFLTGFLCGAAAMYAVQLRIQREVLESPDLVARFGVFLLDRELSLTHEQRKAIFRAIEKPRPEYVRVLRPVIPELLAITDRTRDEVRSLLNDEQRSTFDRLTGRQRARVLGIVESIPAGPSLPPAPAAAAPASQ